MRTSYGCSNTVVTPTLFCRYIHGRRMVVPYQLWMLQGISDDVSELLRMGGASIKSVAEFLARCGDPGGMDACELLRLPQIMTGCRVRKLGGKIYTEGGGALMSKL